MLGTIPLATSGTFPLQVLAPDLVSPSAAFLASDVLAAYVWSGDDMPPIAMPAARWVTAGPPDYEISFTPLDLVAPLVMPGIYRIRATATRGADTVEIFRDSLEVTVTEGQGVAVAAPLTYCSYEDMAVECNWIDQFHDVGEDQTGFLEQRVKATLWMDGLILYAQPVGGAGALISRQSWWSWSYAGIDAGSGNGLAIDRVLADYLAAGKLTLTGPEGARIVTACSCYAVALVLNAQLGLSPQQSRFAGKMMRRAQAEASMVRAEVDIDGTGQPGYCVNLGTTNSRYS